MTFDLRTPNSNLTCILVSSNYTSKIFKIRPTFLKLLCGNQFEYIMSCDLWPLTCGLRRCELDLYFSVIYLHTCIKNIQNPFNIFEVIVRKPIWIYNELWPLNFDLWTPNSNLTCILVSSTYTSKIFKTRPTFLKLLCGNQFEYIMSCDLWPLTCGHQIRTWPVVSSTYTSKIFKIRPTFLKLLCGNQFEIYNELWPLTFDLRTPNSNLTCILVSSTYISKISKIRPRFLKLLCGNQFGGRTDGRTDGRTGATHDAPSRLRLRGHKKCETTLTLMMRYHGVIIWWLLPELFNITAFNINMNMKVAHKKLQFYV